MPLTYYIDGYNVIHHCSQLKPLARQDFEAARDTLIDRVSHFCGTAGQQAKIIFDGRGRRADPIDPFRAAPGLEVVYSPRHQSADTVIERRIYAAQNRRDLVVVSSDRGICDLCRGLGALVMSPDSFLKTVEEHLKRVKASRQRAQTPAGIQRMEDRLDPSALDKLNQLKKRLEPPADKS